VSPLVSEPTVMGEIRLIAISVTPPLLDVQVATKASMGPPPLLPAVKATMPASVPVVTDVMVGALGVAAATKLPDALEAAPLPMMLVARAVHVYGSPLVSELTTMGEVAPLFDSKAPPLLEVQVAVKPVMALPPSLPAVKATDAPLLASVTEVIVGALGGTAARMLDEGADAGLLPTALVARTVQV